MSIYDSTVQADLEDIFTDDDGFWETHNVNGTSMKAIIHGSMLTARSAIVDMGTFGADAVVIVRASDYGSVLPEIDAIFMLDSVEYRVSSASRLGGLCLRIGLRKISG